VSLFTALLSPLTCVVLVLWMVKLGYSRRTAVLGGFILAFASPYWHFAVKGFYSEPYFTLALLLAGYLLLSELPLASGLSGLAFGLACGSRVVGLILLPAFILSLGFRSRARGLSMAQFLREAGLFSGGLAVCVALIGWANYTRFGSPLKTGYHVVFPSTHVLLSTPLFQGIVGILFDGEVGLLTFAPWLLLLLMCLSTSARAHPAEFVLCAAIFLLSFTFVAKYGGWHAGWVVGPRMLSPTLPFLVIVMAPYIERLTQGGIFKCSRSGALCSLLVVLLVAGFLIQLASGLLPQDRYYTVMEFYADKPAKPWWTGSIPLASIDFIAGLTARKAAPAKPAEFVDPDPAAAWRDRKRAWAAMNTATTEEEFLHSFPNSENLTLPNLMFLKLRPLGWPGAAEAGYVISVGVVGLAALASLKRALNRS
jgi:hypothetical protein